MFCFKKPFSRKYFSLFVTLLLVSCGTASTSLYNFDYPLTSETAKSKTTSLNVKIPQGWFTADDNENNFIDLWLIKDDYSANLQLTLLNPDSLTKKEIGDNGLDKVTELSKDFRIAKYGKSLKPFSNEESFELNKNRYAAYQYLDDKNRNIRVVVFSSGNKFYELTAIPIKTNNVSELYKIQNSVLSSIN